MSLFVQIFLRMIVIVLTWVCIKLKVPADDASLVSAANWISMMLVTLLSVFIDRKWPKLWEWLKGLRSTAVPTVAVWAGMLMVAVVVTSCGVIRFAEDVGLRYGQGTLNAQLTSGKITRAQYDAVESVIVQVNTELTASGGTLTAAQADRILQAAADAGVVLALADVQLPAVAPLPTTVTGPTKPVSPTTQAK